MSRSSTYCWMNWLKSMSSPTVITLIGGAFYLSSDIALMKASRGDSGFSYLPPDNIDEFCPYDIVLKSDPARLSLFESSSKPMLDGAFYDLLVFLGSYSAKNRSFTSAVSEHI